MAARLKTTEWWFPMSSTSLAAATRRDFAAMTVYAPENTSRTIRSAVVEVACNQADAAATSMTSWLIGIKIDAVAFDDVTVTDTIANTAEHSTWRFSRDVTSYFVTNFTGTSHSVQVGVSFGATSQINITAKLVLTYEFSDTSQTTRIKTVRIPLDCSTAVLTATLAELGTNQIPLLTGGGTPFLPENSVVVRNYNMVVEGNGATTAVTDFQVGIQVDATAEVLSGLVESALISATLLRFNFDLSAHATTAAHQWKMRTTVASLMCWQQCYIVITYEYNHASTTVMLNSRVVPFALEGPIPTSANGEQRFRWRFNVPEPATITLRQSGLLLNFTTAGQSNVTVAVGTQADRTYTHTSGTLTCGGYALSHRFDAGAAAGTGGLTIARGQNTLNIAMYAAAAAIHNTAGGLIFLNYESGVDGDGCDAHSHSIMVPVKVTAADNTNQIAATLREVIIPEASYRMDSVGIVSTILQATANNTLIIDCSIESGEGGPGWIRLLGDYITNDGELSLSVAAAQAIEFFKRWPVDGDPLRLVDIETTARDWRTWSATNWSDIMLWVDYSAITFAVAGTVSGYTSGDGSGITVEVFDPDDVKVDSTTTATGGTYSVTVYDDRAGYYAVARKSATEMGRSDDVTPT
jgi:hypothetical protein